MEAQSKATPTNQPRVPKKYTLEEYFELEYKAEQKHEFWNGEIRATAYASPEHGKIQTNLMDELVACLKAKGCTRYTSDRMILTPECNKVFYPDITIICGEELFKVHKKKMRVTLNPVVLIEISSDSTDKWQCYRSIPSLQQYLIVAQNTCNIQSYRRKTEREWNYSYANQPEETFMILDCAVSVETVYAGVSFIKTVILLFRGTSCNETENRLPPTACYFRLLHRNTMNATTAQIHRHYIQHYNFSIGENIL
jgi:Uma2 family endonuclease